MAETTEIAWTDATFNPWIGCTKVHAGCTHCYAESYAKRYGKAEWGPNGTRVKTSDSYWKQPLKWNREAESLGERKRVFCASLADVFEDWAGPILGTNGNPLRRQPDYGDYYMPDPGNCEQMPFATMNDLRRDLFALIDQTPWLDWLLLSKRPENVRRMWCSHVNTDGKPPSKLHRSNVWLGTSVSDQATADVWIPRLLECRDLCPVLFLSCEPLLGPIEISRWMFSSDGFVSTPNDGPIHRDDGGAAIDWVIAGGESGPHARPCNVEWIRSIVEQCRTDGVSCFVKQLGSNPRSATTDDWPHGTRFETQPNGDGIWTPTERVKLKDKKGGDINEFPDDLRVREFPTTSEQGATHARET